MAELLPDHNAAVDVVGDAMPMQEYAYNDDLLLADASRTLAKLDFPRIVHVLDNPELRAAFERVDGRANRRRSDASSRSVSGPWSSASWH